MIPKAPKTLINVLSHLYKISDDFPYSQLALCLDTKNLFDLLRVFGGQNLYIPTTKEFIQLIQFCIVEEIGDFESAVAINSEVLNGFTKTKYNRMLNKLCGGSKQPTGKKGGLGGEIGLDYGEDLPEE